MKLRSKPARLRKIATLIRFNYPRIARELQDASIDIECMAEDLQIEREVMREMADELVLGKYARVR